MSKKLVFLLIILLLAGGLFWYVSKKTVAPVIPKPAPVVTPEPTITPTSDAYPQHIEAIPGNTDEVWYNIPELGVRMRLNKEFAQDLVYQKDQDSSTLVYFSTKSLLAIEKSCIGALGTLFRAKGNMKEIARVDDFLAARMKDYIQIGEYYYGLTDSGDVCWNPGLESEARKVFPRQYPGSGAKNMSEGLKTIELIPNKM